MPLALSTEPQTTPTYNHQIKALVHFRYPRRVIGKEQQKAHLAIQRERAHKKSRSPNQHKEPADLERIDTDVLAIEGVARLLFCSVDHARNIPAWELPRAKGLGKRFQYLRSDVIKLIRNRQSQVDKNSMSFTDLLDSEADNVRRCT